MLCATCCNHLYSLELLMIGIIVSETCWADYKFNKPLRCQVFNFADLIHVVSLTVIKLLDWNNAAFYLHRLSCIIAVSGRTAHFVSISFSLNGYDIYGNHSNGARFHSPPRHRKSSHHCNIVPSTKEVWPSFLSNVTLLLTEGVTWKRHTCHFSCENSANLSIRCTSKVGVKATQD